MEPWTERGLVLLRALYADGASSATMAAALGRGEHELFPGIVAAILADAAGSRLETQRLCAHYNLDAGEIAVVQNAIAPPDITEIMETLIVGGLNPMRRVLTQSRPLAAFEAQLRTARVGFGAAQLAETWRTLAECEMIVSGIGPGDDDFDIVAHRWRLSDDSRAIVSCRLYPEHRERRRPVIGEWLEAMGRKRAAADSEPRKRVA